MAYWSLSVLYVLIALPLLAIPGDGTIRWLIRKYTQSIRWSLKHLGGVNYEIRGKENLPDGAFVIAAKHQATCDERY